MMEIVKQILYCNTTSKKIECIYLPIVSIASVYKIGKNYYLIALLKECNYAKKKIKARVHDKIEIVLLILMTVTVYDENGLNYLIIIW